MEDSKTFDYSLLATLEDEIIKEFVVSGYKVLERDYDMIYRLFSEESTNYKHINRVKNAQYSSSAYARSAGSTINSPYLQGYGVNKSVGVSSSSELKNYDQEYQSTLKSADKIVSYRVIESGIVYDEDEREAEVGHIEREARTILEVRLIDAKTSEILKALTLDGKANDFIPLEDRHALENFSYRYYSHTLPKTHGNPVTPTFKTKKIKPLPWILGGLGSIILIATVSSGG